MSADQQWQFPLRQALDQLGLRSGSALDLGTGPGTQALQLAQRGFDVTATDISEAAVRLAREKAKAQGLAIIWQQDDILATQLSGPFDPIFDRGYFHVLPPERRPDYVSIVVSLLKPGGYCFLKCFSQIQPGTQGHTASRQSTFESSLGFSCRCIRSRKPSTRARSIRCRVRRSARCSGRHRLDSVGTSLDDDC